MTTLEHIEAASIVRGLKSKKNMTRETAEQEFARMFNETEASEACAIEDQQLLGDACRQLRETYGVRRNELARRIGCDSMRVSDIERRCSTKTAKDYRLAVLEKLPKSRVIPVKIR